MTKWSEFKLFMADKLLDGEKFILFISDYCCTYGDNVGSRYICQILLKNSDINGGPTLSPYVHSSQKINK